MKCTYENSSRSRLSCSFRCLLRLHNRRVTTRYVFMLRLCSLLCRLIMRLRRRSFDLIISRGQFDRLRLDLRARIVMLNNINRAERWWSGRLSMASRARRSEVVRRASTEEPRHRTRRARCGYSRLASVCAGPEPGCAGVLGAADGRGRGRLRNDEGLGLVVLWEGLVIVVPGVALVLEEIDGAFF